MKLKKKYRLDNNRQIWRIIPTNDGKLYIEEREPEKKQAYFHCLLIDSGKKILTDFQLDDKFWIGIEDINDDIIYFHMFAKPDMPKHRGIFAFDITSKEMIWQKPDLTFLFRLDDKIYTFKEKFEGRNYFSVSSFTGEVIEDIGDNHEQINILRNLSLNNRDDDNCLFPEVYNTELDISDSARNFINSLRNNFVITGNVEYIQKNELLLMSFHEVNPRGSMNNLFKAVDLSSGKYILEEVINKETSLFLTDSFFIKDNLLFLLFGKTRLVVYGIVD
jgi:hypothetical protein